MFDAVLELAETHFLWPDPTEALVQANKILYTEDLANVAKRVTNTWYPVVAIVPDPMQLEWNDNLVLKRNFSDCGDHAIHRQTKNREVKIHALAKQTISNYKNVVVRGVKIRPTWFAVPYIPLLRELGEMGALFLWGKLRFFIWTRQDATGEWFYLIGGQVTPLDLLS